MPLDSRYGHSREGKNLLLPGIDLRFLSGLARSLVAIPTELSRFVMHNTGVQVSKTYCITLMSAVLSECVLPPDF
jgi:hypothetical protein